MLPLPNVTDVVDRLSHELGRCHCVVDLANAFFSVDVTQKAKNSSPSPEKDAMDIPHISPAVPVSWSLVARFGHVKTITPQYTCIIILMR